jgi:hypothetical protein
MTVGARQIMARAAEPRLSQEKQEMGLDFDRRHRYVFDKESRWRRL